MISPVEPCRVAFWFNHEANHQIAHAAPIAAALARSHPWLSVTVLTVCPASERLIRRMLGDAESQCQVVVLGLRWWQRLLAPFLDPFIPFNRLSSLFVHRRLLGTFAALVVPERTSLVLKRILGRRCPPLIHTKHGSGDRAQGARSIIGRFDLVLLSGRKVHDRLVGAGVLAPDQAAIVGYVKFDAVRARQQPQPPLFADAKPVVLYNPHPDAYLSSWYDMGRDVLEYFHASKDYNLIFAPHVMLFRRRLHFADRHLRARIRRGLPKKYFDCPHIKIDTGSDALSDMTYTDAADIYLGDVSSQIYEFLRWPRPCVFLNAHHARWREDPNYFEWNLGPVVSKIGDLDRALREAVNRHEAYRSLQEEAFRYTFDLTDVPSSERAAAAIAEFIKRQAGGLSAPRPQ